MKKPLTLCEEFINRFDQLCKDGKYHWKAIQLAKEEFIFKIIQSSRDCFFFTDGSGCDYMFNNWHITKK